VIVEGVLVSPWAASKVARLLRVRLEELARADGVALHPDLVTLLDELDEAAALFRRRNSREQGGARAARAATGEVVMIGPMTRTEAAVRLRVSEQRVSQFVADGRVGGSKVDGRLLVDRDDVEALARSREA
jgi:excisionase family DNA binding protein